MQIVKGTFRGIKFQKNETFNLDNMTDGRGAMHLTVRNTGNVDIIIDDHTQEVIKPDHIFVVEGIVAVLNQNFKLKFGSTTGIPSPIKEGIIRFCIVNC
ncbi:hypothetical protein [Abyssalbus ytuae]|uniref:Uncharacterized protein n=1 Tax=Abyssalbus ytuae TaxID=2926907 RepID=A0A9E6ZQE2_9FLAO|nr:hypothetical protein [Abyssalbus ytuae]UOB18590.1 hypothetical protein MQE35_04700 [Abyssalbus ytuae]